jgi:integrase
MGTSVLRAQETAVPSAFLFKLNFCARRSPGQSGAAANIVGTHAMLKGLRHGFGVHAFQSLVPDHLVQRWLDHASLKTTSIYGDVIGPDERAFAACMWAHAAAGEARKRGVKKQRVEPAADYTLENSSPKKSDLHFAYCTETCNSLKNDFR